MEDDLRPDRLVVIGASAGGVDALGELLASLPREFPAPIVVAQHLDPRRPSHLGEILERRTALVVRTVSEREPLADGVVYIVPSDRDVDVADGSVAVHQEASDRRPRPSVDHLFESASRVYGEGLIAVVLTGAGSDGAEGARKVKAAGGTVVIQDPATAAYPSMPQSLAPTTVDIVARLEAIGPVLIDLLSGHDVPPDDAEEQTLLRFLADLRSRSGIDFSNYKRPTIMRRLTRRMAAVRVTSVPEYVNYAMRNPEEYERLTSSFLIKVTEFFRDPELYETLAQEVLPRLIQDAVDRQRELRIWSAGCATGEEAYSLAILLCEVMGDDLASYNVRVFATDLDNDAINFARRGVYSRSTLVNVPPDVVDRYFSAVGDDYEIGRHVRAITVFGQHDLAQRAPFPRIDLAVSRNVLIYFTTELQRRALQLFAFSLREGGYLVLGKAESVSPLPEHFVLENPRLRIYRRHGARVLIPAARAFSLGDEPSVATPLRRHVRARDGGRSRAREARPTTAERAEQILLRLPVGVVVLAPEYDIQLINARARQLLGIHGTAVGQDFVHVARDLPSQALREGTDRARRGESSAYIHELQSVATGNETRWLRLSFLLLANDPERDRADTVAVMVEDITDDRSELEHMRADRQQTGNELVGVRHRLSGLEDTNRQLLEANNELTMANAELRSANEDLLVGGEEIQAATEEVETLNEELQATNEELETLNEELQATVEELNTTNDDLEARSLELEETLAATAEQRASSEQERNRLVRFLIQAKEALAVTNTAGRIILRSDTWSALADSGSFVRPDDPTEAVSLDDLVTDVRRRAEHGSAKVDLLYRGPRGGDVAFDLRCESLLDGKGIRRGDVIYLVRRRQRTR